MSPLFIFFRSNGKKLIKHQTNSSCVIMSVILMPTLFYKALILCGSRKYPYPPHGGSRNFLGVGGSKRDKFLKGRGVHKEFFFPEGLKCDRMNTYVFFQLIRGSQEKPKVLSVEIDVGFLVIYFLLLSRRQMTRTAPRHTSEHVRRRVKQNG